MSNYNTQVTSHAPQKVPINMIQINYLREAIWIEVQ